MDLPDGVLVVIAVAVVVLGFAIPVSRIEARAKDLGHGLFVQSAFVLLITASWPGYWLAMWILNKMHPDEASLGASR